MVTLTKCVAYCQACETSATKSRDRSSDHVIASFAAKLDQARSTASSTRGSSGVVALNSARVTCIHVGQSFMNTVAPTAPTRRMATARNSRCGWRAACCVQNELIILLSLRQSHATGTYTYIYIIKCGATHTNDLDTTELHELRQDHRAALNVAQQQRIQLLVARVIDLTVRHKQQRVQAAFELLDLLAVEWLVMDVVPRSLCDVCCGVVTALRCNVARERSRAVHSPGPQ